ncbi:PP2C family serine/threonine-protein phosphatase [Adhaeribacter radiodurans]|uniref:Protein phosphatase 2C domain-containing protein n=1 Tax=Adhaeribacter radiodurans TaxID=2745197 RepID=A0A7L7L1K3_9BACT|nr:PP2C family serine/threonine-protein phosphatase [Adhaeribacter radiodurans]QMU26666.1 protein phosphatase 2C domain-containing protein [Adhaeribacter radiodurans]
MSNVKQVVTQLFKCNQITIPENRQSLFEEFLQDEQNLTIINTLIQNQNELMAKWKLQDRIAEIMQQPIRLANATVGKPYQAEFDLDKFNWPDIIAFEWDGLERVGLTYDDTTKQISGVPTQSGDIKLLFKFKVADQPEEDAFNHKPVTLIINPDPKSLWKNLESDTNDPHWKDDNLTMFAPLGDRHILVSSKRGRSHANMGSFREDDFAFQDLANGWSLVVVADGAGSAKLSRKGSSMACQGIVNYFQEQASVESLAEFDDLLQQHIQNTSDDTQKKLNRFVYNNLGKAAFQVHKQLETFAAQESLTLKDLSSTLIFTLFKKYEVGYALLSFGVGDCPIAVLNKDISEVNLMNWLDVGEFGGGTRFITMPEIFQSEKFATRFGFKLLADFSYLIMMSDGIYDPKFVVEANLPNIQKWQEFLADLNGQNEEGIAVELSPDNKEIEEQLSRWMDFWSPGNHDDRTLAIVF